MRLVLVGPPGSGKGTQAKKLVEREKLLYIGTGELLREAIRQGTPLGRQIEPLLKQGLLVEDLIVNDVIAELFRSANRPERFVLDGYPRTYAQAISFDALLRFELIKLDAVLNLTIPDDRVVERISGRRCCVNPACGVCYHLLASPPKNADICDKCGSSLFLRDDDREETVRRRLEEFHKNTDALLEHYRRQNLVHDISALDPVETIYNNMLNAVPKAV